MSATTASPHAASEPQYNDDKLIAVINCSRIGLRANPPRRRLLEVLLPLRRR